MVIELEFSVGGFVVVVAVMVGALGAGCVSVVVELDGECKNEEKQIQPQQLPSADSRDGKALPCTSAGGTTGRHAPSVVVGIHQVFANAGTSATSDNDTATPLVRAESNNLGWLGRLHHWWSRQR